MARRKVTMLDAFKVSDRESQERVLAERRRVAAEREKEARRDVASKNATDWGRRLGEGVGSWWSQIRGAEDARAGLEGDPRTASGDPVGAEEGRAGSGTADVEPDVSSAADSSKEATPIDRRPARVSSWEAPRAMTSVIPDGAPDSRGLSGSSDRSSLGSAADAGSSATGQEGRAEEDPATDGLLAPEAQPQGAVLGQSSAAEAGPLRATLDVDEFSLPMSGRAFAALLVVAIGTVFGLGMLLGGGNTEGSASDSGPGAAQDSGVRAGLNFGRTGPRHPEPGSSQGSMAHIPAPDPRLVVGGRSQARGPQAAGTSAAGSPAAGAGNVGEASNGASSGPGQSQLTAAEKAFFDPAMKYTNLAITYARTEANVALAWEAYDFLVSEGFAVVRPFPRKERIFIFVGAAEAHAALGEELLKLRSLRFPPSHRTEFRSAYTVNLSTYR